MSGKSISLAAFLLIIALFTACGDNTPGSEGAGQGLAAYPGATSITIPNDYLARVNPEGKGGKFQAYKTTDAPDKVRDFYNGEVSKNGWSNVTSKISGGNGAQQILGSGGFVVGGQNDKQNSLASVQIIPGPVAKNIGFSELGGNENLIIVNII